MSKRKRSILPRRMARGAYDEVRILEHQARTAAKKREWRAIARAISRMCDPAPPSREGTSGDNEFP